MAKGVGDSSSKEIIEKENVLDILKKTKKAIIAKDIFTLKQLSDRTVHNASLYQDTDSLTLAVLVHSLGKVTERQRYSEYKEWPIFEKAMISNLDKSVYDLNSGNIDEFRNDLFAVRRVISKLSGHLKKYIEEVFRKSSISKASRIYEHGISLEQTASLFGITLFELAEYAGKTGISDVNLGITMPIEKRLKQAEEFFK